MERGALAKLLGGRPGRHRGAEAVVVDAAEPAAFMTDFADAVASEAQVFLMDPAWPAGRKAEVAALARGAAVSARTDRGWLMIPTGGSSGGLKFARHDGHTIAAAVRGFAAHFGLTQVNAVGLLPLHHVSGLMAWMRCALTGGRLLPWSWKRLEAGEWPETAGGDWVASLVPTQLDRLLRDQAAVARLRAWRAIFLGGAPAWPDLLERAAAARLPLCPSYGMTETAAMVTALRPEEFLGGERGAGAALPHVRLELDADGVVLLAGSSLFRGYFPEWRHERTFFATADLGRLDARRRLTVLGRRDAAIITGGEKVQPAEVEAVLRAATGVADLAVVGVPDPEWGERVVCVHAAAAGLDEQRARAAAGALPAAHRPKAYVAAAEWPRSETGKLDRVRLRALAAGG